MMSEPVPLSSLLPKLPKLPKLDMMWTDARQHWEDSFPELKQYQLNDEFYSKPVQLRLLSIQQDQNICAGCPGIKLCPKEGDAKGQVYGFRLDERQLIEEIRTCGPLREQQALLREGRLKQISGMTGGHLRLTFENFPVEQKQLNKELSVSAWEFASTYQPGSNQKGFYIYGDYGTAKTHLACAILNKLVARNISVLYVQAERTFAALSDLYFREDRDGLPTRSEILDKYISADVLVIDELGHENVTDSSIWTLYTILNGREPDQKPVIITSNFKITDLANLYYTKSKGETQKRAGALLSRLVFLTQGYEMKGEDYRTREYLSNNEEE
ncbi:MAG: cell division protein ZapE [Bacilli bacterium]|nr:cell division protein ZapE [Bacilli bacterium]